VTDRGWLPMQNPNWEPQVAEKWVLGTSPRMTTVRFLHQNSN
jgi:hypothetical protein